MVLILHVLAFILSMLAGALGGPSPSPTPLGWRLLCWSLAAFFLSLTINGARDFKLF